ncbi:hypothetical protein [Methanogenium sp. MK-MG]|uniref:hypothetical protein n=1 Tax=Methanogenium sp. MK-MG TaxID=2599926 RepID=UPI0013EAA503|nr:hypothetical protein [Methanogenium sp. MK-MG]KAF1078144.1 hypothetical protein MKMG_00950 [Methanogenium sp. MK-MG]
MEPSVRQKIITHLQSKTETIQRNLRSWTPAAWLMYVAIIPLILIVIGCLSPDVKYAYFILDTTAPHWPAIILSSYTHSDISHIANNIGLYLLALMMIFVFCTNPKLLHDASVIILVVVPFITSAMTLHLSAALGQGLHSQGFSAIAYAYAALGLYAFVCWVMPDVHTPPSGDESSQPYPPGDIVTLFLIMAGVVLVLTYGLSTGGLTTPDGSLVNGPAHVTGFFAGIIIVSLVDLRLKTNDVRINHLFILCSIAMILPYLLVLYSS